MTTLSYYNSNAEDFVRGTVDVDFSAVQERFLKFIPAGGCILDFGCGSGRDSKYFHEKGFKVVATDGSIELCKIASQYTGIAVKQMLFQELDDIEVFDGIWACSSILHLNYDDLKIVFKKIERALKSSGTFYTSFKYGNFSGERNGRYFTDLTKESLDELLLNSGLEVFEYWISEDVRPGRRAEKWLNVLIKKCSKP